MADRGRQSEDWDAFELDAIIADYFAMRDSELAQRPYVKAHQRSVLMLQIGRSAASVEFKHRNISAVLQEMGLPWIWGYSLLQTTRIPCSKQWTDTSPIIVMSSMVRLRRRQ